jgi:hypothetical protein
MKIAERLDLFFSPDLFAEELVFRLEGGERVVAGIFDFVVEEMTIGRMRMDEGRATFVCRSDDLDGVDVEAEAIRAGVVFAVEAIEHDSQGVASVTLNRRM